MRVLLVALSLTGCAGPGGKPDDTASGADSVAHSDSPDVVPVDEDGDGVASVETGGTDCDDGDPDVHPGADEVCDGKDNNCDTMIDAGALDAGTWYTDADGDGYGDPASATLACEAPEGAVTDATDCDDATADAHPGLEEVCADHLDNNCDGDGNGCRLSGEVSLADALRLDGEGSSDHLGAAVAGGVDLNGDGADDLVLGIPGSDEADPRAGAVRVVFGPLDESTTPVALHLLGEVGSDEAGTAVASVGDVDGDGATDVIVGAPGAEDGDGVVYVVGAPSVDGSLGDATARLQGESGDGVGVWLSGVGDVDGDGYADLALGAPGADGGAGEIDVVRGSLAGNLSLGVITDAVVTGAAAGDGAGPVAGLGDVDGDGIADLGVGAPGQDSAGEDAGAACVVSDALAGGSLADAACWTGEAEGDMAGTALAGVGDHNGDGYADWVIGGPNADAGGDYAGIVWLLLGPATSGGALTDASARLVGQTAGETAGVSVAGPGDVDEDGQTEILVGSPWGDGDAHNSGLVYALYGPSLGTISLADAELILQGEALLNRAGSAVASAGDPNGDGYPDLLIGAPYTRTGASDAGAAYLVFGEGR